MENFNGTKAEKQTDFYQSIVQATSGLYTALAQLEDANKQKPSRTISLAITKTEEALMWLTKGE